LSRRWRLLSAIPLNNGHCLEAAGHFEPAGFSLDYVRIVKDKSLLRQAIAESERVGVVAVDQSGSAEEALEEGVNGNIKKKSNRCPSAAIKKADTKKTGPRSSFFSTLHGGPSSTFGVNYMESHHRVLALATAVLALPLFAYAQNITSHDSIQGRGPQEASLMKPVRALLVSGVDANKDHSGRAVEAKLQGKVSLSNGTELPKGTLLLGKVTADDMREQGTSKLALRFDQARLKDGSTVPVRATIVGFYGPGNGDVDDPASNDAEIPIDWTSKTQQMDQMNALPGIDLDSRVTSQNSGVFVTSKKDDVKLRLGSEIQFAIAPGNSGQSGS
jgi:hypothetical protein